MDGISRWFWLGQNLRSIHHAFPRVPFYRYHALFHEIEPILREHGAPVIGIFNRKPVAVTVPGQARPLAQSAASGRQDP